MGKTPPDWRQFAVYVSGGVICALADIGVMQLMLVTGFHSAWASSAGFVVGLLISFAFHSRVTFNAAASPAAFTRYLCLVGLNYALTLGCVTLAELGFDNPLAGKILSLPLVAANGYLFGKYWIFK
ncbi:GtrA family protein [Massilia consociata]|uniref:GtrA family protein n=1 Tax=Massilia consociata TaxID=760117 RepID=A0ABV6FIT2_9BURK